MDVSRLGSLLRRQARHELSLPGLERQGTDVLVYHDALGIDEECFRRAIYAPVDRNAALAVGGDDFIRIAELGEPLQRLRILVLPVESDEGHLGHLADFEQHTVLLPAPATPRAPDVEYIPAALEVS